MHPGVSRVELSGSKCADGTNQIVLTVSTGVRSVAPSNGPADDRTIFIPILGRLDECSVAIRTQSVGCIISSSGQKSTRLATSFGFLQSMPELARAVFTDEPKFTCACAGILKYPGVLFRFAYKPSIHSRFRLVGHRYPPRFVLVV